MSKEAPNIEGDLENFAQLMPSQEMLDLQTKTDSVISTLGKRVPTEAADEELVETPDLYTDSIKGKDFKFRLKKTTHLDPTEENEQFSVIHLIAHGNDEHEIVCATLENATVTVTPAEGIPRINEDSDVALFATVVHAGQVMVDQQDKQQKREADQRRVLTRRTLIWGGSALGAAVVLGVGGYGISEFFKNADRGEWFLSDVEKFDRKGFELSGGSVLTLGQTVEPEFSQDLAYNPNLAGDLIPILTNVMHGHDYYPDDKLNVGDGLRQIIIPTGLRREKPGGSEIPFKYVVALSSVPSTAKFRVWTDLRAPNGRSRADELQLTFNNGALIYEWHGYQLNREKARIVVKIEP